jgi:hypothetical protein
MFQQAKVQVAASFSKNAAMIQALKCKAFLS